MDPDGVGLTLDRRMSDIEALLWSLEKDPQLRATVTSITVLDQPPDRAGLARRIDGATRRVPRLRQRVVGVPLALAPPRWEVDPNFDLRYHLRWVRAVEEGADRELFDIAEPVAMGGFDRARAPWELVVVEGLAGDRAAVVAKVHPAITDGIGGMRLLDELIDVRRHPPAPPEDRPLPPAPPARPAQPASGPQLLAEAVMDEAARQARGAGGSLRSAWSSLGRLREDPVGVATATVHTTLSIARMLAPATEPLSPIMTGRSVSVRFGRLDLSRRTLEAAAGLVNGRLTDAVVTGLTGGLARYHRRHGCEEVGALRLAMPFDGPVRGAVAVTGHAAPMRIVAPIDIDDPLERLGVLRSVLDCERAEPALALSAPLANLINRFPTTVTTTLFASLARGVDVVVALAEGPSAPRFMGGARIDAHLAFAPLAGAGLSVMAVSHGDRVNLGLSTDPAAVPDGDVLVGHLADSFEELLDLV